MQRTGLLRALALAAGAAGIAGMIVTSIAGSTGGALASGTLCVAAFVVLFTLGVLQPVRGEVDPLRAAALEDLVRELRDGGADETKLRRLIRLARGLER
ncbi:MAG: hypothetical protein ACKVUT_07680 [Gaiella sp.]